MKTLKVSDTNHERLMKIGNKTQTVNDIVGILLDEYDRTHIAESIRRTNLKRK